jgi:hypothetical protein
MTRKLSWHEQAERIAELEAEVERLQGLLGDDPAIWEKVQERAAGGDMVAAKLWIEEQRRRRQDAQTGARLTIDDFVVPAGTSLA